MRKESDCDIEVCPLHECLEAQVSRMTNMFWKLLSAAIVILSAVVGFVRYTHDDASANIARIQAQVNKNQENYAATIQEIKVDTAKMRTILEEAKRRGDL